MSSALLDLLELLRQWRATIHASHGVNPSLYLALTTVCAPPFYYSIYRLTKALATRQRRQVPLWSSVFLGATALPYVYVLVFGRNLPWWIYLVLGALLAQAAVSLVGKLAPASSTSAEPWRLVRGLGIRPRARSLAVRSITVSRYHSVRLRFARGRLHNAGRQAHE